MLGCCIITDDHKLTSTCPKDVGIGLDQFQIQLVDIPWSQLDVTNLCVRLVPVLYKRNEHFQPIIRSNISHLRRNTLMGERICENIRDVR